jgi:hypothetical protein
MSLIGLDLKKKIDRATSGPADISCAGMICDCNARKKAAIR